MTVFTPGAVFQVTAPGAEAYAFTLTELGSGFAFGWSELIPSGQAQPVLQRYNGSGVVDGSLIPITPGAVDTLSKLRLDDLADGRLAAVWSDYALLADGSFDKDVYYRLFDTAGAPITSPAMAHVAADRGQEDPAIAALADGGFVLGWTGFNDGTNEYSEIFGVNARVFDPGGAPAFPERPLNSRSAGQQSAPSLAGVADGGFVAVWTSLNFFTDGQERLFHRRFDADGAPLGDEVELALESERPVFQRDASVIGLSDGGFAIAWTGYLSATSRTNVLAKRFDPQGNQLGDTIVINQKAGDQFYVAIAATDAGGFVATWSDSLAGGDRVARVFDAGGEPVGNEFLVSDGFRSLPDPQIAVLQDGGFVIGWRDTDFRFGPVFGRHFDAPSPLTLVAGAGGFTNATGGAGNDQLIGTNEAADRAFGGDGDDRLWGRAGSDSLFGQGGDDRIYGESGSDLIAGGDRADLLAGGSENDDLYGEVGRDTLYGEDGDDRLWGGTQDDRLFGGAGNDVLFGEDGADRLYGGSGIDRLVGGFGADGIGGGDGNDDLYGQSGDDALHGGAGADRFIFAANDGRDTIQDFAVGVDSIVFTDRTFGGFAAVLANTVDVGPAYCLIQIDSFHSILLAGVRAADLSAGDFLFL